MGEVATLKHLEIHSGNLITNQFGVHQFLRDFNVQQSLFDLLTSSIFTFRGLSVSMVTAPFISIE